MRQAGEPSVEEILESIKKVIARDNRAEADQVRRRREEDGMVATRPLRSQDLPDGQVPQNRAKPSPAFHPRHFVDDGPAPVLDLTDAEIAGPEIADTEIAGPETAGPETVNVAPPVVETTDPQTPDAVYAVAPPTTIATTTHYDYDDEAEESMDEPEPASNSSADVPLLAESARASMRESLAALAMLAEPGARPQIVRSGETSLEGLTRDLLRPMLGEWLEKNLPPLVDKMVAAEIARIVGKRS